MAADVLPARLLPALRAVFAARVPGAGDRDGLGEPAVQELAACAPVRALVTPHLGPQAFAFRATLFDKHATANWLVAWHQDRVVPVQAQVAAAGYGPWSTKPDGPWVEPPAAVLAHLLAVRVDLDGSGAANGGLRVLPGSHRGGVLAPETIAAQVAATAAVVPEVPSGGALVLRPLLLHASSRSPHPGHRRIVHLEFAAAPLPGGVVFRRAVG